MEDKATEADLLRVSEPLRPGPGRCAGLILGLGLGAVLAAALLLTACHSGADSPPAAADAASTPPLKPKPAPPASHIPDPTATMAHAVVMDKTGAAVDLMYDIRTVPQVGEPLDVDLTLVVGANLKSVQIKLSATPDLVLSTANGPVTTDVKAGQLLTQHLTVTPSRVGIGYITVAVTTVSANGALERSFSIPLVTGKRASPK